MSTENTPAATTTSALALRGEGWTPDQTAQLRSMGLEHATEPDLKLFFHYAARTGLDPFTRQVYMIGRRTKVKVREVNAETGNERLVERDVEKFSIQVGIDGWRVLGARAAQREHLRVGHSEPLWRGRDGDWRDFWDREADGPPAACKYTLTVRPAGLITTGTPVEVTATCAYAEYVQLVFDKDGGEWKPNSMWAKMPANQLAKCAEAQAWRKAFPADFSGLVLEDAAQSEVIDGEVVEAGPEAATAAPAKRARGAARVRERAQAHTQERVEVTAVEGTTGEDLPGPGAPADPIRRKWINRMFALFSEGGLAEREDQLIAIAQLGKLDELPEHRDGINDDTLRDVVTALNNMAKAHELEPNTVPTLEAQLDDVLRAWEYRQSGDDGETQS